MLSEHKYQKIPQVPTTAVEVYRMLPEGTRCEVYFNEMVMLSPRSSACQLLTSEINVRLYLFLQEINMGKVIPAPIDVYFTNYDSAVQSDSVVLLNDNLDKIQTDGIYGTPDIIIQILPGNQDNTTDRKRSLYEKAGVKEYFLIDPENKKTTLLTLNASGLYEQTHEEIGILKSSLLSCNIAF